MNTNYGRVLGKLKHGRFFGKSLVFFYFDIFVKIFLSCNLKEAMQLQSNPCLSVQSINKSKSEKIFSFFSLITVILSKKWRCIDIFQALNTTIFICESIWVEGPSIFVDKFKRLKERLKFFGNIGIKCSFETRSFWAQVIQNSAFLGNIYSHSDYFE